MGKGDIKSKKGKIRAGSYGVRRKKQRTPAYIAPEKPAEKVAVATEEKEPEKVVAKKTTAKKAPAKKAATTKKPAVKKAVAKKAPAKKAAAKK